MIKTLDAVIMRYRRLPQSARAGIWFTICGFLQKGIAFITVPIFTRLLTTEQYGTVSVFNSWEALLSILCTLNLFSGGFNNGMIDYRTRRDEYVSAIQGLITTITVGLAILYLVGRSVLTEWIGIPPELMIVMFCQVLLTAALSLWSARQRYEFRYKYLIIVTLSNAVLGLTTAIVAVLLAAPEYGAQARIIGYAAATCLLCGGIYYYNIRAGKCFYSREIWRKALWFNLPLLPHYLSTMALNQADRIMIERMVGRSEAGIYSVAYSASMVLNILTTAVNQAFAPWLYRRLEKKEYHGIAKTTNMLFAGLALILILLITFAPECVLILAGEQYSEAVMIIPPVASSLYFIFMYQIFANVEFYFKKNKLIALASVSGALLNIVLNFIGIRIWGYLAAGYTTLICYVLFGIVHFCFMAKICRKEIPGVLLFEAKPVFLIAAGLVAIALLMILLYEHTIIRYGLLVSVIVGLFFLRDKIKELLKILMER